MTELNWLEKEILKDKIDDAKKSAHVSFVRIFGLCAVGAYGLSLVLAAPPSFKNFSKGEMRSYAEYELQAELSGRASKAKKNRLINARITELYNRYVIAGKVAGGVLIGTALGAGIWANRNYRREQQLIEKLEAQLSAATGPKPD